MFQSVIALVKSRKFILCVAGSAICGALTYLHAPNEIIATVAGLFGVNMIGIAAEDFGKSNK